MKKVSIINGHFVDDFFIMAAKRGRKFVRPNIFYVATAQVAFRNHCEFRMQMRSSAWCVNIYEAGCRERARIGLREREIDESMYYSEDNLREYL